jgi:hypothetical protein
MFEHLPDIERDLILLSGRFLDENLPKEKEYLYKYFDTPIQELFAAYFSEFRSIEHFVDHTGFYCDKRWLRRLRKKFLVIEGAYIDAQSSGDFEKIAEISMGNFPVPYRRSHPTRLG